MNYSRQREIVKDILQASYDHPTAEEVYLEAQKVHPGIGIATVYRNLNQLVDAGEIRKIPLGNGNDRFDGHLEEHYHMLCTSCGRLQDLRPSEEKLAELRKLAEETFGLKQSNRATFAPTVMEGVCDKCRRSKKVV